MSAKKCSTVETGRARITPRRPRRSAKAAAPHPLFRGRGVRRVMVCRYCGCDDDHACAGGCSWAAPHVCSACVPRAYVEKAVAPLFPADTTRLVIETPITKLSGAGWCRQAVVDRILETLALPVEELG